MKFFNLDIERAILNSILFNNLNLNQIQNILTKTDFYLPFHQIVFETIKNLIKKTDFIDEFILKDELIKRKKFDEELFFEIISTTPIELVDEYAKIIKELALKRCLELLLKKNSINIAERNTFELIEVLKKELENLEKNNTDTFKLKTFNKVENKDIEFILKDYLPIPKKAITLLSAKGGAGKSWLVLQLALKFINQTNKKVFAWLSEDPDFATKKRAKKILNEILINHNDTRYFDITHSIYENFQYLGSETRPFHFIEYEYKNKKINPLFYKLTHTLKDFDFIILDPLIAFFGGDENNNSQAREFMNLLAEWADKENKAILVVHHNNKSSIGGIRGASAFVDAVRLHYELLTNENNDKKDNQEILPDGYRKLIIKKDNWGTEKILNKKEIQIQIFKNEINTELNKKEKYKNTKIILDENKIYKEEELF